MKYRLWDVFVRYFNYTLLCFLLWPIHFMYIRQINWSHNLSRLIKAFLCDNGHTCTTAHHQFLMKINTRPYQEVSFHHRKWKIKKILSSIVWNMLRGKENWQLLYKHLPATAARSEAFIPTAKNKTWFSKWSCHYITHLRRAVRRPEVIAPLAIALQGSSLPLM